MGRKPRHADFFRHWTPEMAYVLGLWWADGCMRIKAGTRAHEIEIASNDQEHLERIAAIVGQKYYLRKVSPQANTYVISFCSVEMYRDLQSLGGTPRKSRTIGCPEVPSDILAHFVRGIVDGDGTLAWNGDRPILQIYSGSQGFLSGLAGAVEGATGIPAPVLQANRDNWTMKWSTTRAKCLVGWLYERNAGLALERKAAIAVEFLKWQPKKQPNKGTMYLLKKAGERGELEGGCPPPNHPPPRIIEKIRNYHRNDAIALSGLSSVIRRRKCSKSTISTRFASVSRLQTTFWVGRTAKSPNPRQSTIER